MSHLTPHRSVRITPGGGSIPTGHTSTAPVVHDTSWDGMLTDLAAALNLDGPDAQRFATEVNEVVDALRLVAGIDQDVARTKTRGALLGEHGMVTDLVPLDLTDPRLSSLLPTTGAEHTHADKVLARLAALHHDLVAPTSPDPTQGDDQTGEGPSGSGRPLPAPPYTPDDVPPNAAEVISWIDSAVTSQDEQARASIALQVEQSRPEQRKTVMAAIEAVTGG